MPPATPFWDLSQPPVDYAHDLWAVGADLEPSTLDAAYRLGLFPMRIDATTLGWWSPASRGIVPIQGFEPSRSLRRARARYELTVDQAFDAVVAGCADPSRIGSWIDEDVVTAYTRLHAVGSAHSVEAWDDQGLAGGLYGVQLGGLFAAESMFHRRTDASKASLLGLVKLLQDAGDADRRLLDVQWLTPHLERLGAVAIPRAEYHRRLNGALALRPALS